MIEGKEKKKKGRPSNRDILWKKKQPYNMPRFLKRFSKMAGINGDQITDTFATEFWDVYKGKEIYATIINNTRCFTLKQIAYMDQKENEKFETSYDRINQRFNRKVKNGEMIEGIDYYEILPSDKLSDGRFIEKIYITIHSVGKLLYNARSSKELFYWFWNRMSDRVNKISLGESYLQNKKKELIPQVIGEPKDNYLDCMGWGYSSKGEMLIAEVLHKLGVRFQHNRDIKLPQNIKEEIKKKFKCNWSYITADFIVLILPKTIIEYWGMENDSYYDWKRKIKTYIYQRLEIELISIEPHEDQNKLALKIKLEKEFKILNPGDRRNFSPE